MSKRGRIAILVDRVAFYRSAEMLPESRGFAPVTWQILAGENSTPEAASEVDVGDGWLTGAIELNGAEWRDLQGEPTLALCQRLITEYPDLSRALQQGEATFYSRGTPEDNRLDRYQPMAKQFDLLRVVDNQRYPGFCEYAGQIKIELMGQ